MKTFFRELKQRRVYRVALAYVIAASATVQVIGTVLTLLHASEWVQQLFILAVALGFPVALVLAWVFEISDRGLQKTVTADTRKGSDYYGLSILAAIGLIIAGAAVAVYWLWHPWRKVTTPAAVATLQLPGTDAAPPISEKSIAVLPFENLGDDKDNAQFANGVHDEILTDLAKVSDLKVISRTSTMQYRTGAERNLREIGKALGAAHVVEGTVQRTGKRVRVSAQLIDARTDTHLWADHYDRDMADLFSLESELAETIVAQLKSKLSPEEKAAIEERPTADAVAHDLYLRADALVAASVFNVQGTDNLFEAGKLLEQAVSQDPNYFLAYCRLASVHDQIYLAGTDHTTARRALAEAAVNNAQRLRPDAGETHLALAEHRYCGFLDYDRARQELKMARLSLPNEPRVFELVGYIDRRQGRWDDSTRNLARALELDPRNAYLLQQIAISYHYLRRFADEAAIMDRALDILPEEVGLRVARAAIDLDWRADPKPLHDALETTIAEDPQNAAGLADLWLLLALCERDPGAAEQALAAMAPGDSSNEGFVYPHSWWEAIVARAQGRPAEAGAAFGVARQEVAKHVPGQADYGEPLSLLGMIDAALGRKDEAIREGKRAVELLPLDKDSINGALAVQYLAAIYCWVGEKDAAINELTRAAQIPGGVTYGLLRLHPFWDPLRGEPEFEKIVASLAPADAKVETAR
jgi:TolB-like protein/Flp pilus assembly protein TadD